MEATNFYTIGELSSICNVSPKTLRYYDDIGLVQPEYKSEETGYRYYTKKQAFNIYIVKKLQQLDFSLKEICDILSADDMAVYEKRITEKMASFDEKIQELERLKVESSLLLEKLLQQNNLARIRESSETADKTILLTKEELTNGSVSIQTMPAMKLVSTKKTMKLYNNFEISLERWFDIFRIAEEKHFHIEGNVHLRYHTEEPMDQFYMPECELEVMLPIDSSYSKQAETNEDYSIVDFGERMAAVTYHYGSYDTIIQAHLRMMRWLEINKYKLKDCIVEEYIISPFDLKVNSEYLTKIYYPI